MRHIQRRSKRVFTLQLYDRTEPSSGKGVRWGVWCRACSIWTGLRADTGNIDIWVCHSRRTAVTVARTSVCHRCASKDLSIRIDDGSLLPAARGERAGDSSFIAFVKKLAHR